MRAVSIVGLQILSLSIVGGARCSENCPVRISRPSGNATRKPCGVSFESGLLHTSCRKEPDIGWPIEPSSLTEVFRLSADIQSACQVIVATLWRSVRGTEEEEG